MSISKDEVTEIEAFISEQAPPPAQGLHVLRDMDSFSSDTIATIFSST
jgi:hypothetical protein